MSNEGFVNYQDALARMSYRKEAARTQRSYWLDLLSGRYARDVKTNRADEFINVS